MKTDLWAKEDMPLYKMKHDGISNLTNSELLSIIINPNRPDISIKSAKQMLSDTNNSLKDIRYLYISDLIKYPHVGTRKATLIEIIFELAKRINHEKETDVPSEKISSSTNIYKKMSFLGELDHEEFWIVLLKRNNTIIKLHKISSGGFSGTVADPKLIFNIALKYMASSIILCHNHPSGSVKPSESDIRLTQKLKKSGGFLDLPVLDHIIVSQKNYYSFADEGII